MRTFFIIFTILVFLKAIDNYAISPCPLIFAYKNDFEIWTGHLKVDTTEEEFPIEVEVHLILRAVLKTKYVGLIELDESSDISVENLLYHGATYVNYTILFPLPSPIPELNFIYVNKKIICSGPKVSATVITNIALKHKFPLNPYFDGMRIQPTYQSDLIISGNCGKPSVKLISTKLPGLGEWPWQTAILIQTRNSLIFQCSGTLISESHVITAAHCIKNRKDKDLTPSDFLLYFGKHDLNRWGEPNSQIRKISSAILHPEFTSRLYSADLAMLILKEPVFLNKFVKPVCLWSSGESLEPLVGRLGTIVGWGKDPGVGLINSQPRLFQLPIVNQEECLRSRSDFFYITSNRTLCAGLRNGTGPCNGDSGSGLLILKKRNYEYFWELRAVISLSLLHENNYTCDLSNYLVFTDIAKFRPWIISTMRLLF